MWSLLLPISFGTFSRCSHAQKSPFPHTIPMVIFSFFKKDSVQFLQVTPIQLELLLVCDVPGYFSQRALSPTRPLPFPLRPFLHPESGPRSHQGICRALPAWCLQHSCQHAAEYRTMQLGVHRLSQKFLCYSGPFSHFSCYFENKNTSQGLGGSCP